MPITRLTTTNWHSSRQLVSTRYRDGQKAFENASKAYQLTNGNNANGNFSVLASVYAENGDFPRPFSGRKKAIDLTKSNEMKLRYLARVELFKQGKPFRMDPKTAMQVPTPKCCQDRELNHKLPCWISGTGQKDRGRTMIPGNSEKSCPLPAAASAINRWRDESLAPQTRSITPDATRRYAMNPATPNPEES